MDFIKKIVCNLPRYILLCMIAVMLMFQDKDAMLAASEGYAACSDCNGTGILKCAKCDGEGRIIVAQKAEDGAVTDFITGEVEYYYKSYIRWWGCDACGGYGRDEQFYYYAQYYPNADYTGKPYVYTSTGFIRGTGEGDSCTNCDGDGEVAITYQIKYNGNGSTTGKMENSVHTYDESQNLSYNRFTRTGYTFIGWSTTDGVTTDTGTDVTINYKQKESVKNLTTEQGKVINLYAIWKRKQYAVVYDANGGNFEGSSTQKSVYYGDSLDLSPSCTKEGYVFLGWATEKDATLCLSAYKMPAGSVRLYAVYSLPVSDIKEAHVISYNSGNPEKYNLFELEEQSETINGYIYSIDSINLLEGLSRDDLEVWLLLYDHAGNRNQIPIETPISPENQEPEDIPVPNIYLQTVEHYLWNMQAESYQYYMSTSELVYEGEVYVPKYLSKDSKEYPTGYKTESIDSSYTVSGVTTTKAYYKPMQYTLYFDANGGECDIATKSVYMGSMYGELPTPSRNGYDFMGWHTAKKGGRKILATDIYTTVGDSTLYAIWEVHTHKVVYDYITNGGTYAELNADNVDYGDSIDMTVEAFKDEWEFIGWNTDPDATVGLEYLTMGEEDILLYAIYKKDIKAVFVDWSDKGKVIRESVLSIYNNESQCQMPVPQQNSCIGWKEIGWSTSTEADAAIEVSSGTKILLMEDIILYGCYVQEVIVEYDTNGSAEEIEPQIGERYFNASGSYKNPKFILAKAPKLQKHSFVSWQESIENPDMVITYKEGECIEVEKDMHLVAQWDCWPEIEAYDRYFTLEEAVSGKITLEELLKKVIATDKEDGILINGSDVVVKNYNKEDFINIAEDAEAKITYAATDSFQNSVTKTVTIHIVDTTVEISPTAKYVRFISENFYWNETELVSSDKGGVEETSIWRTNESYRTLLEKTLLNSKRDEAVKKVTFFNISADIVDNASGNWEQEQEAWVFSYENIKEIDEFIDTYGFGNIETKNGLNLFMEQFGKCHQ